MGLSHWTVKTILLLSHIALVYGNRVRHTETDSDPNNLSDNELLSRVQSEILSNLGLNEAPRISSVIPEEARQVLIQDAELEEDQDKHFMEDQSNVLLLARKGTQTLAHLPPNVINDTFQIPCFFHHFREFRITVKCLIIPEFRCCHSSKV